jgi:hypothetical protein
MVTDAPVMKLAAMPVQLNGDRVTVAVPADPTMLVIFTVVVNPPQGNELRNVHVSLPPLRVMPPPAFIFAHPMYIQSLVEIDAGRLAVKLAAELFVVVGVPCGVNFGCTAST